MLQYPKIHFSNIPIFHYFNLGEVPNLVQILDFFKCNLSIIFNQFFIESLLAVNCMASLTSFGLQVASYELRVARCALRVAGCALRVARCALRVARCGLSGIPNPRFPKSTIA
jgi:hypothetical protein